jgi:hypothetical protein
MTDLDAQTETQAGARADALTTQPHGGVPGVASPAPAGLAAALLPNVTSEQDGGGPVLTAARISLVYWGSAWASAAASPTAAQFTTALTDLVTGPWGTQLNQYHGIGPSTIDQVVTYPTTNPPAVFVEGDIKNFVDARISDGTVIAATPAVQRIYAVLLPTGHSSGDTTFVGRHQNYFRPGNVPVYYAWVTNDGTLTGGNSIPKVFSHELAESVSDPDVTTGPTAITLNNDGDEIGDVCNSTWATVNGHAEEAYWSQADGRCVIPVSQPLPAVSGNPVLIQSRFGVKGNFELVTGEAGHGLFHAWRNNDNAFLPWSQAIPFGQSLSQVAGVAMIQSNYGTPGNLEVVANAGGHLQFFWRDSGPAFAWNGPFAIEPAFAATGDPVLIQGRFGVKGNFELVVPAAAGGLAHFWRNNDDPALPWSAPTPFGHGLGHVTGVAMIQSNYGTPGNLEVVANAGGQLQFFFRDSGPLFIWNGPFEIEPGFAVAGNPVLIQSRFGTKGNFELVVPAAGGGLAHFWRDNDNPLLPWSAPTLFGHGLGQVSGVTMIQSNYGNPGNLEVICNAGGQLYFFWRDSGPSFIWNGPFPLRATTW